MVRRAGSVTLHDVAKRAGVHFSTVSRALNPQTRQLVSAAVTRKVMTAAAALEYRPNEAAVGLKTRRSYQINVLLPDIGEPGAGALVRGIRERLLSTPYVAIVGDEERLVGQERFSLRAMKLRPIGGLIVATAKLDDELVREAAKQELPLVEVLRLSNKSKVSSVSVDYRAAMADIVDALRAHGHKRIGLLSHSLTLSIGRDEVAGFSAALKNAGLSVGKRLCEPVEDENIELAQQAFLRLHSRQPGLTAVIAAHDKLAVGCIDGIRSIGLSCPKNISVVGFGDLPLTERLSPPLSTMRVDLGRIGRLAGDLIIRAIEQPTLPIVHHVVEPVFVRRGSIGRVARR